ncbi:hypothetical protein P152DRAFT_450362 [Eremomyces bilateralis CBS 781.70]|uniref:Uncharacterized protein n=1 Tax=Eremomyces bilateralis CBS 781.70 TaxID=1392243 RepID=A0A6G1FZI3_9PEZI|nr:uncharacterized protein P152DRAFT_450362 [Eremomyces bilateralis CBS 781.70]KAF1811204.1 hypothetical protein P152DRAFT_450362 [Eremomyces bilateralis CBS 781.70]
MDPSGRRDGRSARKRFFNPYDDDHDFNGDPFGVRPMDPFDFGPPAMVPFGVVPPDAGPYFIDQQELIDGYLDGNARADFLAGVLTAKEEEERKQKRKERRRKHYEQMTQLHDDFRLRREDDRRREERIKAAQAMPAALPAPSPFVLPFAPPLLALANDPVSTAVQQQIEHNQQMREGELKLMQNAQERDKKMNELMAEREALMKKDRAMLEERDSKARLEVEDGLRRERMRNEALERELMEQRFANPRRVEAPPTVATLPAPAAYLQPSQNFQSYPGEPNQAFGQQRYQVQFQDQRRWKTSSPEIEVEEVENPSPATLRAIQGRPPTPKPVVDNSELDKEYKKDIEEAMRQSLSMQASSSSMSPHAVPLPSTAEEKRKKQERLDNQGRRPPTPQPRDPTPRPPTPPLQNDTDYDKTFEEDFERAIRLSEQESAPPPRNDRD